MLLAQGSKHVPNIKFLVAIDSIVPVSLDTAFISKNVENVQTKEMYCYIRWFHPCRIQKEVSKNARRKCQGNSGKQRNDIQGLRLRVKTATLFRNFRSTGHQSIGHVRIQTGYNSLEAGAKKTFVDISRLKSCYYLQNVCFHAGKLIIGADDATKSIGSGAMYKTFSITVNLVRNIRWHCSFI